MLLSGGVGSKRRRWYPHEALFTVATEAVAADPDDGGLPWHLLDPVDAARWLPTLRAHLRNLTRFVAMVEAIADGRPEAKCPVCSSRFYPSRSDARYCSGRCRMRAHRGAPSTHCPCGNRLRASGPSLHYCSPECQEQWQAQSP